MAQVLPQRLMKRRADEQRGAEEIETPCGKKVRASAERPKSTRRTRQSQGSPPVFVIEEDAGDGMAEASNKSPKPPSAEEFKAMLREGLANVAKKEQLDVMMTQIKLNSSALVSLERKFDETNDLNERHFLLIEEKLDSGGTELSLIHI